MADKVKKAIAIFDSGFGGLTLMRQIIKTLPSENIIYFGDNLNAPYGDKSKNEIINLAKKAAFFLYQKDIKALLIGCNTASVYAYDEISRHFFGLPVIDVISPSLKMVFPLSKDKKIGVIATKATIYSQLYRKQILAYNPTAQVFSLACPTFAPMIERGEFENLKEIKRALLPLIKKKIDFLLLACTHYPIIQEKIKEAIGEEVTILDPSSAITLELENFLKRAQLKNEGSLRGRYEFYTSGDAVKFKTIAEKILGIKINIPIVYLS
jgi:glutamate racemase